jgi:predicted phage tail protein
MTTKMIRGAGGARQSESRTPVEAPDSLHSIAFAHILDLISEGEIVGLVNGLNSVYLDETPIANDDGTLNFNNVHVDSRNGTQDQTHIAAFNGVANEIGVSVELHQDDPWVQAVTNLQLSAVHIRLSTPAMSQTNTSNGDITGTRIEYAIDVATDGGPFIERFASSFNGKTSTKYERGHRIDLPEAVTSGWIVRVRRITADSESSALNNRLFVESYSEIIDGKFRYPNSALVGLHIDAQQFQSIPRRAFHAKGRIVSVPSNYDAETRTYDGIWDGTFQPAYTNNPAWVFYDLALHLRYGLGHLVVADQLDKWTLYEIAQYCDGLVDDGNGGTEPRFTCNLYLQRQADAYKVMQDLATVFRGITYWGGGMIRAAADMPADPVYLYTNASVEDGKFIYQGSARKTRFNSIFVSWNDLNDFGRLKIEHVADEDSILRYGLQETTMLAVGCTSQGQAQRAGRWALATSRYETQSVAFTVGIEGTIAAPGQYILTADRNRAGQRLGGRIRNGIEFLGEIVELVVDSAANIAEGDTISILLSAPTELDPYATRVETRTVTGIDAVNHVFVDESFTGMPVEGSSFIVQKAEIEAQLWKVVGVKQNPGKLTFGITAVQHNASKFDHVENGEAIVVPDISGLLPRVQLPPTGIVLTHRFIVTYAGVTTTVTADWEPVENAVAYEAAYRFNDGPWSNTIRITDSIIDIPNVPEGHIDVRVNAINAAGKRSVPKGERYEVPAAPSRDELPAYELVAVDGVLVVDCMYDRFRYVHGDVDVLFINVPLVKTIIIEVICDGASAINFPSTVVPVSGVPYVPTAADGARDVLGLDTTNMGALWKLLVQQPATSFAALVAPSPASDTVETDGVLPEQPSVTVYGTTSGGTEPISHAWTRVDAGGSTNFNIDNAAIAAPTFSIPAGTSTYAATTQTWKYTGTDADGIVASADVDITLERTSSAVGGELLDTFDGVVVSKLKTVFSPNVASGSASFVMKNDGTWEGYTATPTNSIDDDLWTTGTPEDYNVKFTPTLVEGTSGTVTNGASTYQSLGLNRTITIARSQSGIGTSLSKYDVLVEIEEAAAPGVVVLSGTVQLSVRTTVDSGA